MMDVEGDLRGRYKRRIFDAHLHIIDHHFTLVRNRGYLPAIYTAADYCAQPKR